MTGNARKKKDYTVGYGRPPIDGRWQPGTSGNPLGRKTKKKKLPPSIMESFEEGLMAPLRVTVDGKRKTMTTSQALASKAIRGALNAPSGSETRKYLEFFHKLGLLQDRTEDEIEDDVDDAPMFTEEDRRMLEIARRALIEDGETEEGE